MNRRFAVAALVAAVTCSGGPGLLRSEAAFATAQAVPEDGIRRLLNQLEQVVQRNDADAFREIIAGSTDQKAAAEFVALELRPGTTRVVVQERDRIELPGALPGAGYRLTVEAFIEYGNRGRAAAWQIDVKRGDAEEWRIVGQERLTSVENLYRLSLNATTQFDARDFTILAEDLELTLAEGSVFTVETEQGITALVLLGRGHMRFQPAPQTEVEQVRIFAGDDTLEATFDAAFVRAGTLAAHADSSLLTPRGVDPRTLKRAEAVFREESAKSFVVDLGDLSPHTWSLLPNAEDFLAEVRTRRFSTLTYTRSASEAEDISLFVRRGHRNIAVYASKDKLASRGRFYHEDDLAPIDVLDYDIEIASQPNRRWVEGRAALRLRVRAPSLSQLTLRLADSLVVQSVTSDRLGRLFSLRVTNQNTILVNLPVLLLQDAEMTLQVEYAGPLEPQPSEQETLALGQRESDSLSQLNEASLFMRPEPSYLYSNRSYWYPQPLVTDYATATIRISVPIAYACVASGEPSSSSPEIDSAGDVPQARKVYSFTAKRPLRYLAFLVSRFTRADRWTVAFDTKEVPQDAPAAATRFPAHEKLDLIVDANPRQLPIGRGIAERAVDIIQFYESIVGDSPYSTFTVALVESNLPGGHSPAYFASLNQPTPTSSTTWRNDPAAFSRYPEFFLAHEVAHQWWGQAVGWRNYHEQWLSEGFAQYFAALYAQRFRGDDVFESVMRQMRTWALNESDEGPIYLGYRVGHIREDGRAFRAVVYNKSAVVLHMLRRLVGDDAFFRGVRRFYSESRFKKVGSEDFRLAMEAESGRALERFFERWIYNSALPELALTYHVEPSASSQELVLNFEQAGDIFDLPVTLTLQYANRRSTNVIVPVTDKTLEWRVPLESPLRRVEVSRDDGTLAEIRTRSAGK